MKNIFRNYSTWLLLIGVTVSLFAFLNGADVYQRVRYALAEVNNYQYENAYNIYVSEIENIEEVIHELKMLDGNVIITDQHVYLNATGYYRLVNLVVKQDEDFPYPVEYITNKSGVILGSNIREYCYQNGNSGMVIEINGTEQPVAGFVGGGYSDYLDGQIFMEVSDANVNELLGTQDMIRVEYGSNEVDIDAGFDEFYDGMKEKYRIVYEKNAGKYMEIGDDMADQQFYMVIALFAMINCVVISEFWVLRRKEEILIRKLWGFSNWKLFRLMYKEMLAVSGAAVLINLLIKGLVFLIDERQSGAMLFQKVLLAVGFMILSSLIMILVPIHHASKYRISDGLEG